MIENVYVSVIIPVYNTENYVDRCIKSVINQSYQNLDIVLIDDGSLDRSSEICQKWKLKDKRINYIRQKNAGLGAARNRGIKAATADFITFLDSDDWLEPTFVEKIIEAMLETKSEVGQCDIYYVDSATMVQQAVKLRYEKLVVSCKEDKSIVNKSRLFAWGKILRRKLLERCDFNFPDIAFEDICISILMAEADCISYVPKPLINYLRNRSGSLSNDCEKIGDIAVGLQFLYKKWNDMGIFLEYMMEYKKIALGQFRFACRKWHNTDNKKSLIELQKLEQFVVVKFPELFEITQKRFFAFGDQYLVTALDYALPFERQIAKNIADADCIVAYQGDITQVSKYSARIIEIPENTIGTNDMVSRAFNNAEIIMERL